METKATCVMPMCLGSHPTDGRALSEAFGQGSGVLRFALREEIPVAMQRKCWSRKGQLESHGDIAGS